MSPLVLLWVEASFLGVVAVFLEASFLWEVLLAWKGASLEGGFLRVLQIIVTHGIYESMKIYK